MNELKNIGIHCYLGCKLLCRNRVGEARGMFLGAWYRTMEAVLDLVGGAHVTCNICGWSGRRFRTFVWGPHIRHNASCPRCFSLERHRAFISFFCRLKERLSPTIRLLDIAPNIACSNYCKKDPNIDYLSVDLTSPIAARQMDLQSLELPSEQFDVVVCYHVLDYVQDDRKALKEIYRVLRTDGVGILQEYVSEQLETVEWGQARPETLDKVRRYGIDFIKTLAEAGFAVRVVSGEDGQPIHMVAKGEDVLSKIGFEDAGSSANHLRKWTENTSVRASTS